MEPSKKAPVDSAPYQKRPPDPELTAAYEQLRGQVLGIPDPLSRGPGLAVLLERGMKAWMEAYQRWSERASVSQKVPTSTPLCVSVRNEAVVLLTSLLLERTAQEER